nr:hypothetical protein [Tanacetum cinerariifolium]
MSLSQEDHHFQTTPLEVKKRKAVASTSTQPFNASQLSGIDPFNISEVSKADNPRTRASAKTPKRAAFTSAGFIEALKELSSAFRVSIAKDCRLIAELEALRERGDALKPLEYMREMVARDVARVRILEQLLADAHVGIRLKAAYADEINNQDSLWVDLYHNLNDAFTRGDTNTEGLGKRIVLPRTFTGGPRYMMQNYQDAMALCRAYENPDLFITFTSNPKWPKIMKMLSFIPGQKPYERPEVGTQVFKMKLTQLLEDLIKYEIFGKSCAKTRAAPCSYFALTRRRMEVQNTKPGAACSVYGKCSKKYPKPFYPETNLDEDGYLVYHRRDSKIQAVKGKFTYDNNFEILFGPSSLLSTTISLEGIPSPKSLVIRAATSNTVGALYCRADVRSLRRRVSLNFGSNTLPSWKQSENVGLTALLPLFFLSSYHIWALQLRDTYDGGPRKSACVMVLRKKL